jgi:hypothetical protein
MCPKTRVPIFWFLSNKSTITVFVYVHRLREIHLVKEVKLIVHVCKTIDTDKFILIGSYCAVMHVMRQVATTLLAFPSSYLLLSHHFPGTNSFAWTLSSSSCLLVDPLPHADGWPPPAVYA